MRHDASLRRLAVIGVDVKCGVHSDGETLLRGIHGLAGVVRARVAHNGASVTKLVLGVRDQHDMLVPPEEVPLARGSPDNEALDTVLDLVLCVRIKRAQVDGAVRIVGRLDRRHQPQLPESLSALGLGAVGEGASVGPEPRARAGGRCEHGRAHRSKHAWKGHSGWLVPRV
jgi:hypothetical protein